MYTLKLFNNWQSNDREKCRSSRLSVHQVKDIYKIIRNSRVIESTDEYTKYQLIGDKIEKYW